MLTGPQVRSGVGFTSSPAPHTGKMLIAWRIFTSTRTAGLILGLSQLSRDVNEGRPLRPSSRRNESRTWAVSLQLGAPSGATSMLDVVTWNLGGQPVEKLHVRTSSSFKKSRGTKKDGPRWKEMESDTHFWLSYRAGSQWRGTAIGISNEIFDSVISRKHTTRGILALVKLRGRGRVLLGSIHCTGVTNRIYQQAVDEFVRETASKWRRYPCIIGTDLNETIRWGEDGEMMAGTATLNYFINNASAQGWTPVTPKPECRRMPTRYPRDANREGCQIDALWSRQCD